jgi:Domain of unknown function (DUF397)
VSDIIEVAEVLFVDGADVPVRHKHADHMVVLRDAANPDGDALYYTPNEWEAFLLGVKDGEFDDMTEERDTPSTAEKTANQETRTFPWTGRQALPAPPRHEL